MESVTSASRNNVESSLPRSERPAALLQRYKGVRVLVTGHTGFKGSWLVRWLSHLGADLAGFSLGVPTSPSHYQLLQTRHSKAGKELAQADSAKRSSSESGGGSSHELALDIEGDIRDLSALHRLFEQFQPQLVFHLAAQPIVLRSYEDPIETFSTNVMGTLNVLEAARRTSSVRAFVNVTSDKCYENREWVWGYRENDPMGGYDPYSASKGCAELLASSYQRSFLSIDRFGQGHDILMSSVRAGNVIGGGDWAQHRIIPDLIRAIGDHKTAEIRNPNAIRPWQHVLEPLFGYLLVGARLLSGDKAAASPFNFGPDPEASVPVIDLLGQLQQQWPKLKYECVKNQAPHEAGFLRLDSTKARTVLGWRPLLNFSETAKWTADWYRSHFEQAETVTDLQIAEYQKRVQEL